SILVGESEKTGCSGKGHLQSTCRVLPLSRPEEINFLHNEELRISCVPPVAVRLPGSATAERFHPRERSGLDENRTAFFAHFAGTELTAQKGGFIIKRL